MAANSAQNTSQIEMCWAAADCEVQVAARLCLCPNSELIRRPSSELIREVPNSDQSLIPALPGDQDDPLVKGKCSKRESSSVSEQARRKRMKDLCSYLEHLLPWRTLPKLDRYSLYEEACNYIQKLQNEVEELRRRREICFQAKKRGYNARLLAQSTANYSRGNSDNSGVEAVVKIYDREAIITITSPRKPRCHWRIVEEVETHGLDVQMSEFFAGDFIVLLLFRASVNADDGNPLEIQTSLEHRLKVIY